MNVVWQGLRAVLGLLCLPWRLVRARRLLAAWNAHDAAAIEAWVGAGTYQDPLSRKPLNGAALRAHAGALFTAFPDLRLVVDGPLTLGAGAMALRYTLDGQHLGPLAGGLGIERVDATGKALHLPASLFLVFGKTGVEVHNHFDLEALANQLGFLALLMPRAQGDYQFGAFYRLSRGNRTPPEAIGLTWLEVRGEDQFEPAARVTNAVLESFADRPGFVSGIIGARPPDAQGHSSGFTLSAWESLEALEANLLPNEDHRQVVHRFMKAGLAYATHSRVYQLVRAKPVMMACLACGKKNNAYRQPHVCSACGAELGEAPAYW